MGSNDFQIFVKVPFPQPFNVDTDVENAIRRLGADPELATAGSLITLVVQPQFTILQVKALLLDRTDHPVNTQRLIFGSHQLLDSDTLSALNIVNNGTLHLLLRLRGGMPKKGAKKTIGKPEKLQQLHAMHMYHMTKTPSIAVVINPIHAEGYIANTIDGMTETQCLSLKSDYNELGQLREISLIETVSLHFVDQIDGWKDEIATLQSRIATAGSAVQVAFSKEFYGVSGLVYERFFELVNVRLNTFEENRANAQIQAVQTAAQAQIHAAQAAAQAQVQAAQLEARQFVDAEIARMNAAAPAPMDQDM
jgi:large subunit ribosomal protein L40e